MWKWKWTWGKLLTPTRMLLKKLVLSSARLMRMLATSMSVAGGGRLKAVFVAEIEIGMVRSWHFLAVTAVARARRSADLNMAVVRLMRFDEIDQFNLQLTLRLVMENKKLSMLQRAIYIYSIYISIQTHIYTIEMRFDK